MTNQFQVFNEKVLEMPGRVFETAFNHQDFLYAILRYEDPYRSLLSGIDLDKGLIWTAPIELHKYYHPFRVDRFGYAWIGAKNQLFQLDTQGNILRTITLALDEDQMIGSLLVLEDSLLLSIQADEYNTPNAKVMRIDLEGNTMWESPIDASEVYYPYVLKMMEPHGNEKLKSRPKSAFQPKSWVVASQSELLLSQDSLLASYVDMPSSGLGASFCLDVHTGQLKWTDSLRPSHSIACLNQGIFMIGMYGYGAFKTKMYNKEGKLIGEWDSTGTCLVTPQNEIYLVEMTNDMSVKQYYAKLRADNTVQRFDRIGGYYMVYPLLDDLDNTIFWRDYALQVVDKQGRRHILKEMPIDRESYSSERMMMTTDGKLVFGLENKLNIIEANVGKLGKGVWPCLYGNMRRNPVVE